MPDGEVPRNGEGFCWHTIILPSIMLGGQKPDLQELHVGHGLCEGMR